MNKSDYASQMDTILNTYLDYLEFGFKQPHPQQDFSNLDIPPEEPEAKPIPTQTRPAAKKQVEQIRQKLNPQSTNPTSQRALIDLAASILNCQKCPLHIKSFQRVPGAGNPQAKLFIITYPVSRDEEQGGIPFAHNFREDLTKWLSAIDIGMDEVFITNILKCCPHRAPLTKEHFESCRFYLDNQIQLVNPAVIVTLGQVTFSSYMRKFISLAEQHGNEIQHESGPVLIPTFHPFDLRKSPDLKRAVWEDLKKIKQWVGS